MPYDIKNKNIISFAFVIAATSLLQQLFHSMDTAVVGRFAGSSALAAVGSTASITALVVTVLLGVAAGVNVYVAQRIGEGSQKKARMGIDTALILGLVLGIVLTIIGEIGAEPLLRALQTPADIIVDATLYLRIYFLGVVFLMIYNVEAAIFRASGDAKLPIYSLVISGVFNLVLNLFFVAIFKMGVAGVALATLISDVINAAIMSVFLIKRQGVRITESFNPSIASLSTILAVAIPAIIQEFMFTFANLVMQYGFNKLGSEAIAAATISINIELVAYYIVSSFGQAALTFGAKAYGAGDYIMCRNITRRCLLLGFVVTAILSVIILGVRTQIVSIFTYDEVVANLAITRLGIVIGFEVFDLVVEVISGAFRAQGRALIPTIISAVCICGTRLFWILVVFPRFMSFGVLVISFPVSWVLDATILYFTYKTIMYRNNHCNE